MKGAALARAAGEVFATGLLFQAAPESERPEADALRAQLVDRLDAFSRGGVAQKATPEEVEQARFGLVAWLDEVVHLSGWRGSDEWERDPLQLRLFGTRVAGSEFYQRLEGFRPESAGALEVYFYCLALGFQGSYAGRDGDRQALLQRTLEKLRRVERAADLAREKRITPTAYKVDIALPGRAGRLVSRLLVGAAGLLLVYGLLWTTLFYLAGRVPAIVQG